MPDDSLSEELSEEEFKSKHFLHRLVPSCTDDVRRNVLSPYVQPHVVRQDDGMLWSSTVAALCKIRARRKTKVSPGRAMASRSFSSSARNPLSFEAVALGLAAVVTGPSTTTGSGCEADAAIVS